MIDYLISPATLSAQLFLPLRARKTMFENRFSSTKISHTRISKLYKRHGIR